MNSTNILKPDEQEYFLDAIKGQHGLLDAGQTSITDNANHKFTTITSDLQAAAVGEGQMKPIGDASAGSKDYKAKKFVVRVPLTDESIDPKTVGTDIIEALQPDAATAINQIVEAHFLGILAGTKQSSGATIFEQDLVNNKTLADTEIDNITHDGLRKAVSTAGGKIEDAYGGVKSPNFVLLPGDAKAIIRDARATNDSDRSLYVPDAANYQNIANPLYWPEFYSTNLAKLSASPAANKYVGLVGVRENLIFKILDDISFRVVSDTAYTNGEDELVSTTDLNEKLLIWEFRIAATFKKADQFAFIANTTADPTPTEEG